MSTPVRAPSAERSQPEFYPKGAIAFFAAMMLAYGAIWLALFFLLVHRKSGI